MAISTAQKLNIVCPEGDLVLRVAHKGSEGLLLVSPQVLVKASKSFSRLLPMCRGPTSMPFAFTNEVKVPDDDADALLTICNILHGRNQQIPDTLSLDALREIALSSNRHQLTSVLLPWSSKWLDHALSNAVGNEVYTVVAIAVDLGVSSTLRIHDTCRPYKPFGVVDPDRAGVTRPLCAHTISLCKADRCTQAATITNVHRSC